MSLWQNVNNFNNSPSLVSAKIGTLVTNKREKCSLCINNSGFVEVPFLTMLSCYRNGLFTSFIPNNIFCSTPNMEEAFFINKEMRHIIQYLCKVWPEILKPGKPACVCLHVKLSSRLSEISARRAGSLYM